MKNLMRAIIDDLSRNLFSTIIVIFFGGFIIYSVFIDDASSYVGEDEDGFAWEEHANQQLAEDYYSELEAEQREIENNTLYYIDNGYYLHRDINCKGLDGYRDDNLNRISVEDAYEYQELSPCNWCVKSNN